MSNKEKVCQTENQCLVSRRMKAVWIYLCYIWSPAECPHFAALSCDFKTSSHPGHGNLLSCVEKSQDSLAMFTIEAEQRSTRWHKYLSAWKKSEPHFHANGKLWTEYNRYKMHSTEERRKFKPLQSEKLKGIHETTKQQHALFVQNISGLHRREKNHMRSRPNEWNCKKQVCN